MKLVLSELRKHKFYLKSSKCSFAQSQIDYLGHIISREGVVTDPSKTKDMVNWPTPTNIIELRGFLGLTGYYRRFVKNYGIVAKPLTNLLKKNQFVWSTVADQAFHALKKIMTETPVLILPDFSVPFVVDRKLMPVLLG